MIEIQFGFGSMRFGGNPCNYMKGELADGTELYAEYDLSYAPTNEFGELEDEDYGMEYLMKEIYDQADRLNIPRKCLVFEW